METWSTPKSKSPSVLWPTRPTARPRPPTPCAGFLWAPTRSLPCPFPSATAESTTRLSCSTRCIRRRRRRRPKIRRRRRRRRQRRHRRRRPRCPARTMSTAPWKQGTPPLATLGAPEWWRRASATRFAGVHAGSRVRLRHGHLLPRVLRLLHAGTVATPAGAHFAPGRPLVLHERAVHSRRSPSLPGRLRHLLLGRVRAGGDCGDQSAVCALSNTAIDRRHLHVGRPPGLQRQPTPGAWDASPTRSEPCRSNSSAPCGGIRGSPTTTSWTRAASKSAAPTARRRRHRRCRRPSRRCRPCRRRRRRRRAATIRQSREPASSCSTGTCSRSNLQQHGRGTLQGHLRLLPVAAGTTSPTAGAASKPAASKPAAARASVGAAAAAAAVGTLCANDAVVHGGASVGDALHL